MNDYKKKIKIIQSIQEKGTKEFVSADILPWGMEVPVSSRRWNYLI